MPKERYRLYHREKAIGGVGLTMNGGSAVVAPDSPPSFGNLLLYKDEIVPWLRRLTDDVHEAGAAVMCQVTHLGRRTSNFTGDWLPLVYASPLREPAHRSFPKAAEPWDLDRSGAWRPGWTASSCSPMVTCSTRSSRRPRTGASTSSAVTSRHE